MNTDHSGGWTQIFCSIGTEPSSRPVEKRNLHLPRLHLATLLGWSHRNFVEIFSTIKLESMSYRAVLFLRSYVQPFWYNTSLWLTDRRTRDDSKYRASIASRGKIILDYAARYSALLPVHHLEYVVNLDTYDPDRHQLTEHVMPRPSPTAWIAYASAATGLPSCPLQTNFVTTVTDWRSSASVEPNSIDFSLCDFCVIRSRSLAKRRFCATALPHPKKVWHGPLWNICNTFYVFI